MIYIDYVPGTHGNFLSYAINTLDPEIRKFNVFTPSGTSHMQYPENIATSDHYNSLLSKPIPGTQIITISVDPNDCLLVNLLIYSRGADYNFNLRNFNVNFRDQLVGTIFENIIDKVDSMYGTNIRQTNSISRSILRDYFKHSFIDYSENDIIQMAKCQKYDVPVFEFNFKELYDFKLFLALMRRIVVYFSLPYQVDVDWYLRLWRKFISKLGAVNWAADSYKVYDAVLANENVEVDFNILQESWLNARLEIVYNKNMPIDQDYYFKNTKEIIDYLK